MSASSSKSSHILSVSSNLLGLCFIVMTSLKVLNLRQNSIVDEITAVASVAFMLSSILSFLSIRTAEGRRSKRYEDVSEVCFIIGLSVMFIITMVIAFDIFN